MDWLDDESIQSKAHHLQMYSYGVRPLSVFKLRPNFYASMKS